MTKPNPSVPELIAYALEKQGFDGLYCEDICACELADIANCGGEITDCVAGYRMPCTCGEEHTFHINESRDPRDNKEESE